MTEQEERQKQFEELLATPEDVEAYRRLCKEIDENPEKYKDYAWSD